MLLSKQHNPMMVLRSKKPLLAIRQSGWLTFQFFDQLGELMVKKHLLWRGEDRLRFLGGTRVQLVFGDKAQLLHKVLLPNAFLNQLLEFLSEKWGRKEVNRLWFGDNFTKSTVWTRRILAVYLHSYMDKSNHESYEAMMIPTNCFISKFGCWVKGTGVLLGVVLQWVVIVVDADAKEQRTQALH